VTAVTEVSFRAARRADVPAIVALLADDELGATREIVGEDTDAAYWAAFEAIDADPRNVLVVADQDDEVVGPCTSPSSRRSPGAARSAPRSKGYASAPIGAPPASAT
jgi:hypothetical protein